MPVRNENHDFQSFYLFINTGLIFSSSSRSKAFNLWRTIRFKRFRLFPVHSDPHGPKFPGSAINIDLSRCSNLFFFVTADLVSFMKTFVENFALVEVDSVEISLVLIPPSQSWYSEKSQKSAFVSDYSRFPDSCSSVSEGLISSMKISMWSFTLLEEDSIKVSFSLIFASESWFSEKWKKVPIMLICFYILTHISP